MNHRVNSSVRRNQNIFIQQQVEACRKAGAVRIVCRQGKRSMTPDAMVKALESRGLNARVDRGCVLAAIDGNHVGWTEAA